MALRNSRDCYVIQCHIYKQTNTHKRTNTYPSLLHGRPTFAQTWSSHRHGRRGLLRGWEHVPGTGELDCLWQVLGQVQSGRSLGCLQREETCLRSCSEFLSPSQLSGCSPQASALLLLDPLSGSRFPGSKLMSQLLLCWTFLIWCGLDSVVLPSPLLLPGTTIHTSPVPTLSFWLC